MNRRTIPLLLTSLLPAFLIMSGCKSTPHVRTVSHADSGGTIQMTSGDLLRVELEANPTTGYAWQTLDINPWVLGRTERPEFHRPTSDEPLVGAGGVLTLDFRAVGTGTSPLKLAYTRAWETNVPPARTFDLTVVVR